MMIKVEFLKDRGSWKKGDVIETTEKLARNLELTGKDSVKILKDTPKGGKTSSKKATKTDK